MKETQKVKCHRCLRIRDLFQYLHFEEDRFVDEVKDNGAIANPRYTTRRVNLAQCTGLCEECAVEVNKRKFDSLPSTEETAPQEEWEKDFDNFAVESCGKWKIDRVLAKQFIRVLISQAITEDHARLQKEIEKVSSIGIMNEWVSKEELLNLLK